MKTFITIICLTSFSLLAGVEGIVTATKLNIRVKPDTKYAVVAQLKKGQKVNIVQHQRGWYEISAPESTKVFVAAGFLQNGRVVKEVYLRAGPSVAFSSFRTARPGEQFKVVDKSRKDWLQIQPPGNLTAWTSARYIYLSPENAAKLAGKKLEKKPEVISEDKKSEKDVTKKTDKKTPLPFTEVKGKQVSVEGYLVSLSKDSIYVTHAVASRINGEYFPLCYVHSKNHKLKLWENRRVVVTGVQRWVKNWQRLVVEVEKINPAW